jgi:rod shape determining protein RodA
MIANITARDREVVLPFIVAVIIGIGLLGISSVVRGQPELQDTLNKQLLGVMLAVPMVIGLTFFSRNRIYAWVIPLFLFAIALQLATTFIGVEVKGQRNWLKIGPLQFQPLEFTKFALILMLSRFMREPIRSLRDYIPMALIALPIIGLVAKEDTGGATVLIAIVAAMLLVRGFPLRHFLVVAVLVGVALPTVVWPNLAEYQKKRITIFLNPAQDPMGAGYQIIQAKVAIGSGGLTGKGYGAGTQSRLGYLPESENDMIFAAWAEEQGFVGAAFLLLAFAGLFWRLAALGAECVNDPDKMVIAGVIGMLGAQVMENIGAALGLAPLTGLTLPLVSAGLSSLLAVVASLTLVYIIHRDRFRDF